MKKRPQDIFRAEEIQMKQNRFKDHATATLGILLLLSVLCLGSASADTSSTKHKPEFTPEEKAWLAEKNLVRVRIGSWRPFHFYQDGFQGICVEYMDTIAERAGFSIEYVTGIPWSEAFSNLEKPEKIDLILTAAKTEKRAKHSIFTDDYLFFPLVIFTRKDSPFISSLEDLRGKTIIVERSFAVQEKLARDFPDINLHLKDTTEDALKALSAGVGDAYVGNLTVATYLIEFRGYNNIKVAAPTPYETHNQAMAIRRDWPQLASIINKTLQTFSTEEHAAIRNNWLSPVRYEYGVSTWDILKWILGSAIVALTIISIILLRNKRLRIEIVARKKAEERLRESEERTRTIYEQAPLGIALVDSDSGKFIDINLRFARIFGRGREEMVGLSWEDITHPDDMRKSHEKISRFNKGEISGFNMEKRYLKPDGTVIWGSITVTRFNIAFADSACHLCMLEDISSRRQLEEDLRHSHKMEAVGTLAGGIAHDFNNMLAIIQGNIQMARHKLPTESKARVNLERVSDATIRAVGLVRQLLAFSRRQKPTMEPCELVTLVGDTLPLLSTTLPPKVETRPSIDSNLAPLTVNADASQLQQMLTNLCVNASEAMNEEGRVTVSLSRVELSAADIPAGSKLRPGEYARLNISDTGTGIANEDLKKIFDPFYTTKKTGAGTGMGLAVVHGIVEDHAGLLTVDSTPGQGTTVSVFLPVVEDKIMNQAAETLAIGTEKILLIDDETDLVEVGKEMLEMQGFKVTSANSGKEALDIFREQPRQFDLIITDQTMPEMAGMELAQKLLNIRPDIPIILCSGYSGKVTPDDAIKLGIRAFCMKPLSHQQLIGTVRQVLDDCSG
jgi:PAS domain S-box-containing protein